MTRKPSRPPEVHDGDGDTSSFRARACRGTADSLDENRSFERFFDAERTRLFGALAVMSGNRAEAEEVMQDAFLKVWERWGRVSAMESPRDSCIGRR